ncbi:hypothetical protein MMC14_001829, partial [Varicellaria rhodocarpa]|nr:hypothetical protein [Varicellaria rhodocarpa]
MNTLPREADQEQQLQTSDLWPENLGEHILDTPYLVFNQPAESSWLWPLNVSWSSQQLQIDTPDGTCGTPQWSGSIAMETMDQPTKPDSYGQSIFSLMGMDMDFLEETVEDQPCLQQMASSEFYTPMLNIASWAGPTASLGSGSQALNNFQPIFLQH